MSETATCSVTFPKDQKKWLPCRSCDRHTWHKVLALAAVTDTSPNGKSRVWIDSMIIQCQGCRSVSFCEETRQTGIEQWNPAKRKWIKAVFTELYPPRLVGHSWLPYAGLLPRKVHSFYRETYEALCNKLFLLTSAGIRAIVEAVCQEKHMQGKDLKERIDNLALAGIVTRDGAGVLHNLRFMGNQALHETKVHTEQELCTAFDVVEYLLKGVYILPKQALHLPKPRSKPNRSTQRPYSGAL